MTAIRQCLWRSQAFALALIAAGIVVPATAHADCGDSDRPACTGPVPTVDQVVAIMAELTDPNIPAANKGDLVTPPFNEDQAPKFDSMLNFLRTWGVALPVNFTVMDIQPAPNNLAGATVSNPRSWHEHAGTGPVVLAYQGGHWMITHQTAVSRVAQLVRDEGGGAGL